MSKWSHGLAAVFVLAFSLFFYTRTLYNSASVPEKRISRADLLLWCTLGGDGNPFVDLAGRLSTPGNLTQRFGIFLLAASIMLTATAAGDAVLRLLRLGPFSLTERAVFGYGLGMGACSMVVLFADLAGQLTLWPFIILAAIACCGWLTTVLRVASGHSVNHVTFLPRERLAYLVLTAVTLFCVFSLLAAVIPTPDYDALAYHLLGPKDWYLAGRIHFLPHNVYTTFPFLTEMFSLLGMVVARDWFSEGLVGQCVLWSFGPMCGLAVGLLASRLFGPRVGWLAALVFLTTPWTYRLSSIPYVEGALLFFTVTAVDAASRPRESWQWAWIAGVLAGCAFTCKYTGLFTTVVPVTAVCLWASWQARNYRPIMYAALGVVLVAGPWLVRNTIWTNNPVYPLAHGIFQSPYWTDEQAERFHRAHHSSDFGIGTIWRYIVEIPATSDWQSGLVFAFAPLALLGTDRKQAWRLWLFVGYLFFIFWGLTHRLDRFWLPLEPFAAVLAGAGIFWLMQSLLRPMCYVLLGFAVIYNLAYVTSGLSGVHTYTADLKRQRESRVAAEPSVAVANSRWIPHDATVLFVGYAGVYYAERQSRYNTVFDKNLLLEHVMSPGGQLRPAREIIEGFQRSGIDAIIVDWNWIETYRSPGNYGFPAAITPELFDALQKDVLQEDPTVRHATNGRIQLFRVRREARS